MSGQLPIDIVVRMESALRDLDKFRREGTKAASAVAGSFAAQDPIMKRAFNTARIEMSIASIEKMRRSTAGLGTAFATVEPTIKRTFGSLMSFNATRAVMAGVTASIAIGTKGFKEWAKTSDEAASSIDGLAANVNRLFSEIGQDLDESGITNWLNRVPNVYRNARDGFGAAFEWATTPIGEGPGYRELRDNVTVTRMRDAEVAARPGIIRQRDAERIAAMRARGDDLGVAQSEYDAAISQIGANRAAIRPGAENARELNSLYDTQEETARNKLIAVQDRILKGQMAEEESARRTAEAAKEKAEAELKAEAAKVRSARQSEQEYEFSLRQLMIENQRLSGDEEGAKVAETRLQFDRQRYNIATDESIGTSTRNSLIRRTDAIEAGALSALSGGTVSPIQRSYQAPGFLSSGTYAQGLLASAFAPAGAGKPVEQAQLDELRKIRLAVEGGGATFN